MFKPSENCSYAQFGLQFAKHRFPLGGINRKVNFDKNVEEILPQIHILHNLRAIYDTGSPDIVANYLSQLKGAYCGELCAITRLVILANYPKAKVEMVSLDHHQLLVINRHPGNPEDVTTWVNKENEGYFLDVWADDYYPISLFEEKQRGKAIPFYIFGGPTGIILNKEHYLSGTPKILPPTNMHNDALKESASKLSGF